MPNHEWNDDDRGRPITLIVERERKAAPPKRPTPRKHRSQRPGSDSLINYGFVLACFHGACLYCGADAESRDHVVPRSKDGHGSWWNMVPACVACNHARGALAMSKFLVERDLDTGIVLERWSSAIDKIDAWHQSHAYTRKQCFRGNVRERNDIGLAKYKALRKRIANELP